MLEMFSAALLPVMLWRSSVIVAAHVEHSLTNPLYAAWHRIVDC